MIEEDRSAGMAQIRMVGINIDLWTFSKFLSKPGILFRATAQTLLTIAADPKHLGAKIGFFAVLHTWGSNLLHHPHLHCVVPGGGFAPDGSQWICCRDEFWGFPFFVNKEVVGIHFLLTRSLFACDILSRSLPHVSPVKPTSAAVRFIGAQSREKHSADRAAANPEEPSTSTSAETNPTHIMNQEITNLLKA